ncbi:MAG: hypothetical protein ACLVJ6_08930 [Merdibacter sp.]
MKRMPCRHLNNEPVFDNPKITGILFISDEPYYFHNASIRDDSIISCGTRPLMKMVCVLSQAVPSG